LRKTPIFPTHPRFYCPRGFIVAPSHTLYRCQNPCLRHACSNLALPFTIISWLLQFTQGLHELVRPLFSCMLCRTLTFASSYERVVRIDSERWRSGGFVRKWQSCQN
jgi:hypothetical protein